MMELKSKGGKLKRKSIVSGGCGGESARDRKLAFFKVMAKNLLEEKMLCPSYPHM